MNIESCIEELKPYLPDENDNDTSGCLDISGILRLINLADVTDTERELLCLLYGVCVFANRLYGELPGREWQA
jgi:hypothetical protein